MVSEQTCGLSHKRGGPTRWENALLGDTAAYTSWSRALVCIRTPTVVTLGP